MVAYIFFHVRFELDGCGQDQGCDVDVDSTAALEAIASQIAIII
jgi:hypothetical protein